MHAIPSHVILLFPPKLNIVLQDDNMAAISITKELLSLVSPYNYTERICCLDTDNFVTIHKFRDYELGKLFDINKVNCVKNGGINNNHLYEVFGRFSDKDAESVQSDVVERIETGKSVYTQVCEEFFDRHGWSFKEWALAICSHFYHGDEMLLFTLCRIFHQHAVVVCKDRYWSTFDINEDMLIGEILDACDLHFIYLRPGVFAELKLKKKHGTLTSFSPLKFPEWTMNADCPNHDEDDSIDPTDRDTSDIKADNLALIRVFLNIEKQMEQAVKGRNTEPKDDHKDADSKTDPINDVDHQDIVVITVPDPTIQSPISLKENCIQSLLSHT